MFAGSSLVSDRHPLVSLLTVLITLMLGYVIGSLIGFGIISSQYEGDLLKAISSGNVNDLLPHVLLLQGIISFVALIFFPIIHITVLEKKTISAFFQRDNRWPFLFLIVSLIGFNFYLAISPLMEWNAKLALPEFLKGFEEWARIKEDQATQFTKAATEFRDLSDLLFGLFVIALIPAVGEELVFRGIIQNELWRSTGNAHVAIWISAFLFSAIHLQFFGFIPRLLLGGLFGYLYYLTSRRADSSDPRNANLLIPMMAHFFNNAFLVIGVYFYRQEVVTMDIESTEAAPWYIVLICLTITFGLLYYFRKFYSTRQSTTIQ